MPLMQGKSKKSFESNLKTELNAGKPKDQALAISYSIQKKNRKASGGKVGMPITANEEHMHDISCGGMHDSTMCKYADGGEVDNGNTTNNDSQASADSQTLGQKIGYPQMAKGGLVHHKRIMANENPKLEQAMAPMPSPDEDLADSIMNKRKAKMMAYGGQAEDDMNPGTPASKPDDRRLPESDYMSDEWAGGSDIEPGSTEMRPSEEDYMADHWADGGEIDVPTAIMRKRRAKMMAEGGQVGLNANSEEDLNNEDQMSFEAGLKEQYDDSQISDQPEDSNEHGDDLEDEDEHDMVSSIRRKMKAKLNR